MRRHQRNVLVIKRPISKFKFKAHCIEKETRKQRERRKIQKSQHKARNFLCNCALNHSLSVNLREINP